jgi:hypothetical protein
MRLICISDFCGKRERLKEVYLTPKNFWPRKNAEKHKIKSLRALCSFVAIHFALVRLNGCEKDSAQS